MVTSEQRPILVVDDDVAVRDLLTNLLEDEGFAVFTAEHGKQALGLLEQLRPDLILLDLTMPVMDGRDFYREIRSNGLPDIPVLIVSASDARAVQRELGADGAIAKPFDLDHVVVQVNRLLSGR